MHKRLCWILTLILLSITAYAQDKPCPTASKFGPDDQIGNVNYITPAKTLAATKLVTTGKAIVSPSKRIKTRPHIHHALSR